MRCEKNHIQTFFKKNDKKKSPYLILIFSLLFTNNGLILPFN